MPIVRDQALVVRRYDFSETSQVVACFTRDHGLLRLIAKGVRRGTRQRFAPGLDLLELGDLAFVPARTPPALCTLSEWCQRDAYVGLRRDRVRLYAALYAAELVSCLTEEGDPHRDLFDGLRELLETLAGSAPDPTRSGEASAARHAGNARIIQTVLDFQRRLLRNIGYLPELRHCADCGRVPAAGSPVYFCSSAGGLLCRDCEMNHPDKRALGTMGGPVDGPALTIADWLTVLNDHLCHIAGRRFTTFGVLGGLHAEVGR